MHARGAKSAPFLSGHVGHLSSALGHILSRSWLLSVAIAAMAAVVPSLALGQEPRGGGEANLVVPPLTDTSTASFFGVSGASVLMWGILICALGLAFGLYTMLRLRALPVHRSMLEISELIYETCKTYLQTQIKFITILWVCVGTVIVIYFGVLQQYFMQGKTGQVIIILLFSLIGIAGSTVVAWFGMRVNTYANSRTAFSSLNGKAFAGFAIPLQSGMSIGMMLISVELLIMLSILLFLPGSLAGSCFIGFAVGESLGAAALRIAGGIFTKIADIGSDLMKIVFKIKEDDARNPGVIADCTGDNAGDSVGPTADGFETYGVTGVALISFILLAVREPAAQIQLLVWIFVMRIVMIITSGLAYYINDAVARSRWGDADHFNAEKPLTSLVWTTSILSVLLTFIVSKVMIPDVGGKPNLWWQLAIIISCGTLAGAIIPELVKVFTSTESAHVKEVVTSAREGGASLDILSGFVAGNFSSFWMGMVVIFLMGIAYLISLQGLGDLMPLGPLGPNGKPLIDVATVFAFGLVALASSVWDRSPSP